MKCKSCQTNEANTAEFVILGETMQYAGSCDDCADDYDRQLERDEIRHKKERARELFLRSAVPERYRLEVKDIKRTKKNVKIWKFIDSYKPEKHNSPIVIYGKNGIGKTLFLAKFAQILSIDHRFSRMINEPNQIMRHRSDMDYFPKFEKMIYASRFILFDDVGTADYKNEHDHRFLYEAWDLIYNSNRKLICTTNYDADTLQQRMGKRCYNRLERNNPEFIKIG